MEETIAKHVGKTREQSLHTFEQLVKQMEPMLKPWNYLRFYVDNSYSAIAMVYIPLLLAITSVEQSFWQIKMIKTKLSS